MLLTEQEIEDLYHTELDRRELSFARAVEAKVIEKIKAPGPSAYLCTHIQSGEMVATADDSQDIFDKHERALWFIEPLYRLHEGVRK